MDSTKPEVSVELLPYFRFFKDGSIERLITPTTIPPSIDPHTGVSSKDVVIVPEINLSARLYLPQITDPHQKLPLLVYFHGGGFCMGSAFNPGFHHYLNLLVSETNAIAVSVDYTLAPENPLPIAYEDSWKALEWVASGSEPWLKDFADLERVFMAGDSAGANIAHNMGIRNGENKLKGLNLVGTILNHPYFILDESSALEVKDSEMKEKLKKLWLMVCPGTSGFDDPLINPLADGRLGGLGCKKVLICVAEKDSLRDAGKFYHEILGKRGWGGEREFLESEGENHVFHLAKPDSEKAMEMMKRSVLFINN